MSKKNFISVLIANFNNEKYIKRCLDSLSKQRFKRFEVIFFDDKSTDRSVDLANKFKNKLNIKIIKNYNNKEKNPSYNQINSYVEAFRLSKGEIIIFLDSDDFFEKSKLYEVFKFFETFKNKNLVVDLPFLWHSKNKFKFFNKNSIKILKLWEKFPPQSCISLRRSFFLKIIRNIKIKKFPRVWLDTRILLYSYFVSKDYNFINKYLTYYFQHLNAASSIYKFLSFNWWLRREETFNFLFYILKKNKMTILFSVDYILTKFVNILISIYKKF
jgi:glycosyltransferase involved in cell wall biosynthesis